MNKKLFSAMLIGAAALTIGSAAIATPCNGPCPIKEPKAIEQTCPSPQMQRHPMSPEEHQKAEDARRAAFDKRMNLTAEQKAKLEKIKADEKKILEPIHKKMEKNRDAMKVLVKKEIDVRTESMKKFEAILTEEQKAELEKMKVEFRPKMKKDFGPRGPRHMMKPSCAEPQAPVERN